MEMAQLDYHVTPFRAERFAELYRPAVPRVLAYGAKGYLVLPLRGRPGPLRARVALGGPRRLRALWFSREMQESHAADAGAHAHAGAAELGRARSARCSA